MFRSISRFTPGDAVPLSFCDITGPSASNDQQQPDRLHLLPANVAEEASVAEALVVVSAQAGHLDIVVNNAVVHLEQSAPPIEQVDFSGYLDTFQVNTLGPLKVIKHALPMLRRGEKRLIATVSSEADSISATSRRNERFYL